MTYIKELNGVIIYKIDKGYIKNSFGQYIYIVESDCLREWSSRQIKYTFYGSNIKDYYGRWMYSVSNGQIKDYYGRLLFTYDHKYIKDISGRIQYVIDGPLTQSELMGFVCIMIK